MSPHDWHGHGQPDPESAQAREDFARESDQTFAFVMEAIGREQKRNDVQAERIKALTGLVEKLIAVLMERNTVFADELMQEIAAVRAASAPVSLKK